MIITGFESNIQLLEEIGKRIKKQRIDLGLTQNELAKKAGVSLRTVSNVENGEDIKLSVLIAILRAENLITNLDVLVPEVLTRPTDYLILDKPRTRVRKKKEEPTNFKWGDEK